MNEQLNIWKIKQLYEWMIEQLNKWKIELLNTWMIEQTIAYIDFNKYINDWMTK